MKRSFSRFTAVLLLILLLAGCGAGTPGTFTDTGSSAPADHSPGPSTPTAPGPDGSPAHTSAGGPGVRIEARFVDVGQGDCEILKISRPGGSYFALVDTGVPGSFAKIDSQLAGMGCPGINTLVLTHPDADHIGSVAQVVGGYRVDRVWQSGFPKDTRTRQEAAAAIEARGIPVENVQRGRQEEWNGATVTVFNPAPDTYTDPNNASVVLLVSASGNDIMLMGDAEDRAQASMAQGFVPDVEVYKVPHHGSAGAVYPPFLAAARPDYSVIEVGAGNRYGHPSPLMLQALSGVGSTVYRTDLDGDVSAVVTPSSVSVKPQR